MVKEKGWEIRVGRYVLVTSPKYRKKISKKQEEIIRLVYRYRFVTTELLGVYLNRNKSSVYESLYNLINQGYIAKRYESTYRLRGRPASYYLANKGIRYIRDNFQASETILRNYYKNKTISEEHIDHCQLTLAVANAIVKLTKDGFKIYATSTLSLFSYFEDLKPLPDLYIERKRKSNTKQYDYLVDVLDKPVPFFVLKKRLRAYQDHCDDKNTEDRKKYPHILLVAPNDRIEARLQEMIYGMLQDFELYTTTIDRILSSDMPNIWRDAFEQEEDEPAIYCGI